MQSENIHALIPPVPPNVPRLGNGITRWLGRHLLSMMNWKVEGQFPDQSKLVVAAAPHTSNWDFVIAMLVVLASGVKISFLMKKEAFFWPLGKFFMWLGGIPLDRSATEDTVLQIIEWYRVHQKVWVVITPEGTRAKVAKWKTGFLRIAENTDVPVLLVAWDYPSKTLFLDKLWETTGDHVVDAEIMHEYINAKYRGKYPENQ